MLIVHGSYSRKIRQLPFLRSRSLLISHGIPVRIHAHCHFSWCILVRQHPVHSQHVFGKDELSTLPAEGMEGMDYQYIGSVHIGKCPVFPLRILFPEDDKLPCLRWGNFATRNRTDRVFSWNHPAPYSAFCGSSRTESTVKRAGA